MKTTILALSLATVLAACNQGAANNAAGAAGNSAANSSAGLPTPSERPAQSAGETAIPPGLNCVRNRLSPEERREVAAGAIDQAPRDDPRLQSLVQAVAACGDESNWSEQKRRFAGVFSMSAAGAAGLQEFLRSRDVNVAELDRLILSDRELLAAADAGQLGTAGQAFASRHEAALTELAGGGEIDQELGTRIGNYIAFRAAAEVFARKFAQEP
jgi:hypothetical protein